MNEQRRYFWIATALALCLHAAAAGGIAGLVMFLAWLDRPPDEGPILLLPYGDSSVEGSPFGMQAVALGTFHHDPTLAGGRENEGVPQRGEMGLQARDPEPGGEAAEPVEPESFAAPASTAPALAPPAEDTSEVDRLAESLALEAPEQLPTDHRLAHTPAPAPAVPAMEAPAGSAKGSETGPGTDAGKGVRGDPRPGVKVAKASGGPKTDMTAGGSRLPQGQPALGGTPGFAHGVKADGLPRPYYPPEALRQGLQGDVEVWLRVAADGTVSESRLQQSCGYRLLDVAALDYARQLRFIPARRGNQAVEATAVLPVSYRIRD